MRLHSSNTRRAAPRPHPGPSRGRIQGWLRGDPDSTGLRPAALRQTGIMELVDRVRAQLPSAVEKRMFGGTEFVVEVALV